MSKKKDWSLVVWLAGWILRVVMSMKKINSRLNVPFEAYERLGTPQGEATLEKIVRLIHDEWFATQPKPAKLQPNGGHPYRDGATPVDELPPNHYRLHVTYAPLPPKAELEQTFGKGNVSDIFDGREFRDHASCTGISKMPSEQVFWVPEEGEIPEEVLKESEQIIAWGDRQRSVIAPNGYRPATKEEHYEFQRQCWINWLVSLGSFALFGDRRYVPMLFVYGSQRVFGGVWFDGGWGRVCRFLFVRK